MKNENLQRENQELNGTVVHVLFRGFPWEIALELRSAPGAFTALAWLPDPLHEDHNDHIENEQWKRFHEATGDAFCDLGARTVWINQAEIRYIRLHRPERRRSCSTAGESCKS